MKQSKKRSRVSKSRNACNRAKIAGHKEQMTLKQLSDTFGSVTMTEAASSSAEPDPKIAVETLAKCVAPKLDQGQSGYNTDKFRTMKQSKKKRSRVSKSRNANAKIADHKEQIPQQLSDAFGSVAMTEAASSSAEPDLKIALEIFAKLLDQERKMKNQDRPEAESEMKTMTSIQSSENDDWSDFRDDKMARDEDIFTARDESIENEINFSLIELELKQAMNLLKLHLVFGALMQTVQKFGVIVGAGESELKTSVINLLQQEGIQFSEEYQGTMLVIRLSGQKYFRFLDSDSDSDYD